MYCIPTCADDLVYDEDSQQCVNQTECDCRNPNSMELITFDSTDCTPSDECIYNEWTEWTECTAECRNGKHFRVRRLVAGSLTACDPHEEEEEDCGDATCPMCTDNTGTYCSMDSVCGQECYCGMSGEAECKPVEPEPDCNCAVGFEYIKNPTAAEMLRGTAHHNPDVCCGWCVPPSEPGKICELDSETKDLAVTFPIDSTTTTQCVAKNVTVDFCSGGCSDGEHEYGAIMTIQGDEIVHDKVCKCCSGKGREENVTFVCEDGTDRVFIITQMETCCCSQCGAETVECSGELNLPEEGSDGSAPGFGDMNLSDMFGQGNSGQGNFANFGK